jgi:hypothetical protein
MDKDEALKLALEALEDLQRQYSIYPNSFWDWSKGRKAITAIKQALAAPVQEPVGKVIASVPHLRSISVELLPEVPVPPEDSLIYTTPPTQPAPVQEPVAWMRTTDITELTDSEPEEDGYTPLYTTPPAAQRQWVGLTDEEFRHANKHTMNLPIEEVLPTFTRTIESKLKEKNT